jgi:uncharacterized protein YaiL (DUF2058 family)
MGNRMLYGSLRVYCCDNQPKQKGATEECKKEQVHKREHQLSEQQSEQQMAKNFSKNLQNFARYP